MLVSHNADDNSLGNARCVAPGRFRKMVGIAYRLALVAVGEGDIAVSLSGPVGWDYAAGHALLRAVDGVLLDEHGRPVTYSKDGKSGVSRCFGSGKALADELRPRQWKTVLGRTRLDDGTPAHLDLAKLAPGRAIADAAVLNRAQGCLLGQIVGDALGSLVEHGPGVDVGDLDPAAVRRFRDGGVWDTIAGQPTDDSELALMLARTIVASGDYDREAVAQAYLYWFRSNPFGIGGRTRQALEAVTEADVARRQAAEVMAKAASTSSRSNGSLMRASPLGTWGCGLSPEKLAGYALAYSALTHPNPVCQEACAVYTVAIAHAVASGCGPSGVYERALAWAEGNCQEATVLKALRDATTTPPAAFVSRPTRVHIALQNAFYRLLYAPGPEVGVVDTIVAGGDTDTNAAIAGALLGAVRGREAIPLDWRRAVLSCRPI